MSNSPNYKYFKINIDGNEITGSSQNISYTNWIEGYSECSLYSHDTGGGIAFDHVLMRVLVTQSFTDLYEKYLSGQYSHITITCVQREYKPNRIKDSYEAQRTVFSGCKIISIKYSQNTQLFMDIEFIFDDTVEVTFQVPKGDLSGTLDKIGPIKYSIPKKSLE